MKKRIYIPLMSPGDPEVSVRAAVSSSFLIAAAASVAVFARIVEVHVRRRLVAQPNDLHDLLQGVKALARSGRA